MKIEEVAALTEKAAKAKALNDRITSLKKARDMAEKSELGMSMGDNSGWPIITKSQYDNCGSPETIRLMRILYAAIIDCEIAAQMKKLEAL